MYAAKTLILPEGSKDVPPKRERRGKGGIDGSGRRKQDGEDDPKSHSRPACRAIDIPTRSVTPD